MKYICLFIFSLIVMINNSCLAYKNEPNGFFEIEWNTDSYDVSHNEMFANFEKDNFNITPYERSVGVTCYYAELKDKCFLGEEVSGVVHFSFFDDELISVKIPIHKKGASREQTYTKVKNIAEALTKKYGPATQSSESSFFKRNNLGKFNKNYLESINEWNGDRTIIDVVYYEDNKTKYHDKVSAYVVFFRPLNYNF